MNTPVGDQYRLPSHRPSLAQPKRIKVLSLSGGGYRGLFTAAVINAIENRDSSSLSSVPFGQRFDLIAGTSIGGILAVALSCGVKAARLEELLQEWGGAIFPSIKLLGLRKLFGRAPYNPERLRAAIKTVIPNADKRPLAAHQPGLLLTSVNWATSKLHLLGSAPTPDKDQLGLTLMDAMLATSAAPAHLPPHAAGGQQFVDGGLVANAPDLLALNCARRMYGDSAEIQMLSIGTANPLHGRDPSAIPSRGVMWAKPIIDLVMSAQEILAVQECSARLGPYRYIRLNTNPSGDQTKRMDFDVANKASTDLLLSLANDCVDTLQKAEWNRLKAIIT